VTQAGEPKTLIYVVTEDWYFCSHRLPLARAARAAGYRVLVATRVARHGEIISAADLELVPMNYPRRSLNPLVAAAQVLALTRLYRRERPALVHHVALKPVLLGSVAARLADVPRVVNAIAGFGHVFISSRPRARLLRVLLRAALRPLLAMRRAHTVVQNDVDATTLQAFGVPPHRIHAIRGSGVDPHRFRPTAEPPAPLIASMVSRMLVDKGVLELMEAARILRDRGVPLQVRLVGPPDPDNPASIDPVRLRQLADRAGVLWQGPSDDVAGVWAGSHIAVLPSYREGLPMALLEAAASARPMVATDVPGCREVVVHEHTGLLVPARDPLALADALERLAGCAALRARLGGAARQHVLRQFTVDEVVQQTLGLYRQLLLPQASPP
jgi:glycosyltransferase involved in cell wall biosynthesis